MRVQVPPRALYKILMRFMAHFDFNNVWEQANCFACERDLKDRTCRFATMRRGRGILTRNYSDPVPLPAPLQNLSVNWKVLHLLDCQCKEMLWSPVTNYHCCHAPILVSAVESYRFCPLICLFVSFALTKIRDESCEMGHYMTSTGCRYF